jgi:hypothetical protein
MFAEFGSGQVFWSALWFFLIFMWIWLAITIFADIFRSDDLSGWGKAGWSIFVIFLPYLGVFTYLIARGKKMGEHAVADAKRRDDMFRGYVQDVVSTSGTGGTSEVDQLAKLAALHDQGVIDDDEFAKMKAKVTGTVSVA